MVIIYTPAAADEEQLRSGVWKLHPVNQSGFQMRQLDAEYRTQKDPEHAPKPKGPDACTIFGFIFGAVVCGWFGSRINLWLGIAGVIGGGILGTLIGSFLGNLYTKRNKSQEKKPDDQTPVM